MPPKLFQKKKSKRSAPRDEDDFVVPDDEEPSVPKSKRKKTETSASPPAPKKETQVGKKGYDKEGTYWELGGRLRRATVSEFKGKTYIGIREYYEKDGQVLPGKKGISMGIDQFNAFISLLPQIEKELGKKNIKPSRPLYGDLVGESSDERSEEDEEKEPAPKKKTKVKNESDDSEEEED